MVLWHTDRPQWVGQYSGHPRVNPPGAGKQLLSAIVEVHQNIVAANVPSFGGIVGLKKLEVRSVVLPAFFSNDVDNLHLIVARCPKTEYNAL